MGTTDKGARQLISGLEQRLDDLIASQQKNLMPALLTIKESLENLMGRVHKLEAGLRKHDEGLLFTPQYENKPVADQRREDESDVS